MIFSYTPNFGFALIEAAIALIGLIVILTFCINILYREEKSLGKILKRGTMITILIIFGIIYGIRVLFEIFGMFGLVFKIFNNDQLFFAIMVTLFYPIHKPIITKFGYSRNTTEVDSEYLSFRKFWIVFIVITWIVAAMFLTIPILNIPMNFTMPGSPIENADIFNLGLLWTAAIIAIDIFITTLINRILPSEKRIAKKILRNTMYAAGAVVFALWSLQLFIFEVLMNRWLAIELIKQDIRITILVVSGLYIIFFLNSLKTKFLPESSEKGSKRVQKLLQSDLDRQARYSKSYESELILDDDDSISNLQSDEKSFRPPEGISFKIYIYFVRKFNKSISDEEIVSKGHKQVYTILGGILWSIMILTLGISIFLKLNSIEEVRKIGDVLYLSCLCALFMVIGDFLLIILFNKIIPAEKRVPKKLLQNTLLLGGILTCWIWFLPFLIIYIYLFIWLNDPFIMFITNEVIYSVIMLYISSRIVRWYAGSVKMWNKSKRKANRVSFVWFIINMPLRLFLVFPLLLVQLMLYIYISTAGGFDLLLALGWIPILSDVIITAINIIIGTLLVLQFYKRKLSEAFRLAFGVQIILLIITMSLKYLKIGGGDVDVAGILGFVRNLFSIFNFSPQDVRIPLFVGIGVYIIFIFMASRIKYSAETSEKIKGKLLTALQSTEEGYLEASKSIGNNVVLDVKDLTTYFYTEEGVVKAVEGVSFQIKEGETLGLVGETGCGKSVTALSILKLVRPPGEIKSGQVYFQGEDLHQKSDDEFLRYRGNKITMIFQDPLNSLNPVFKIGDQISEVYRLHLEDELLVEAVKKKTSIYSVARKWSQKMLKDLNIPTPRIIFDRYPHELSGGMRQRVQIAMGLACSPTLLIADEPTTALDVTIQNQILKLMKDLKKKYNTSILFITHDLGIISKMCDRVAVMYSGFIVEYGDIEKLFRTPYHPYARGLIAAVPVVGKKRESLDVIPGTVPNLIYPPSGCRFHPRCQYCFEPCDSKIPKNIEMEPNYFVACHLYDPQFKDLAEISIRKVEDQISND